MAETVASAIALLRKMEGVVCCEILIITDSCAEATPSQSFIRLGGVFLSTALGSDNSRKLFLDGVL